MDIFDHRAGRVALSCAVVLAPYSNNTLQDWRAKLYGTVPYAGERKNGSPFSCKSIVSQSGLEGRGGGDLQYQGEI